ncbi:hypothetical protein B0H13DRAFT_1850974 [Mycena leptocephala]|nr:hypothetical protein B0H13DRAFT_1850974 [Mycena leptocephala]
MATGSDIGRGGRAGAVWVEVFDDSNHPNVEAAFEVPGVKLSELKIFVQHDMLIVQGQRDPRHCPIPHLPAAPPPAPSTAQLKPAPICPPSFEIKEFHYGKLYRALRLPPGTEVAHIRAALADGVLIVTWPRVMADGRNIMEAQHN